ncbi:hypothetical protein ABZ690_08475 [Streptomyces sp. NPDC006967]|uniref:hypothetical protein n=1 Tax=unclassified Streptomyces TaxID=2593676 RepID=UPI001CA58838|nr:hypothetical protein [Streptomyces sp. SM1]
MGQAHKSTPQHRADRHAVRRRRHGSGQQWWQYSDQQQRCAARDGEPGGRVHHGDVVETVGQHCGHRARRA